MSNFERDMANTMLDAADARIASLEADKADLLRVLGVADEKIRSGEDARGQYIRENAALEARFVSLEGELARARSAIAHDTEATRRIAALEARCRELEKECDDADFMDARIADLERQLSQYKEAFHKAFNQFENITVSDTLAVVKERAHQMIGWAYAVLPDYALETRADHECEPNEMDGPICMICGKSMETFVRQPIDCKHEKATIKCPDCGIDLTGNRGVK